VGSSPGRVKPKTKKMVFVASLLSTQHEGERAIMVVIVWYLDLQLPGQLVPIFTQVVRSNLIHGKVFLIQHYVIKFVSDLQQVSVFLQVLRFPPPIKLTATI
jgi:hypothetical protein